MGRDFALLAMLFLVPSVGLCSSWPEEYEEVTSGFQQVVEAAHRYEQARLKLKKHLARGGRCNGCQEAADSAIALKQRESMSTNLEERITYFLSHRDNILEVFDRLARSNPTATKSDQDLKRLLADLSSFRQFLIHHNELGAAFAEFSDRSGAAVLRQGHHARRAAMIMATMARKAFWNSEFYRNCIKTIRQDRVDFETLDVLYARLRNGFLEKQFGNSAERLVLVSRLRDRYEAAMNEPSTFESHYVKTRGIVYRVGVRVRRNQQNKLQDDIERAKLTAAKAMQRHVDHLIAKLNASESNIILNQATFFHGIERDAKVIDGWIHATAEVNERDVFPLFPKPDANFLQLMAGS